MGDVKPLLVRPIFSNEQGRPIKIWLDPHLAAHDDLAVTLQAGGARLSPAHEFSDTLYLILHPASIGIFDKYCHPSWLPKQKSRKDVADIDETKRKVLLTAEWVDKSVTVGRALLREDDWGSFRKGGPPMNSLAASRRIQDYGFSLADLYQLDTEVKEDITISRITPPSSRPPSQVSSRRSSYGIDFIGNAESSSSRISSRRPRTRPRRMPSFEILIGGDISERDSEPDLATLDRPDLMNRHRNLRPSFRKIPPRADLSEVTSASCGSAYENSGSDSPRPTRPAANSSASSGSDSGTVLGASRCRSLSPTPGPSSARDEPPPKPRARHFAQPYQPKAQGGQVSMSNEALETIFAGAEIEHMEKGTPYSDLQATIAKQHKVYAAHTWATYFTDYRNKSGRFAAGGNIPKNIPETHDLDKILRDVHLRAWSGRGFRGVLPYLLENAKQIAIDHPDHGHTSSAWDRFFGTWIRSQVPGESWQVALDPELYASHPSYQKEVFKTEFATVFKLHFDAPAWRPLPVSEILSPKKYLKDMYRAWRRAAGRFKTCPSHLQYTGQSEYIPEPVVEFGKIGAATVKVPEPLYVNRVLDVCRADRIVISKIPQLKGNGSNTGRKDMTNAIWAKIFRNNYNYEKIACHDVGNTLAPLTGFSKQTIKHLHHRWRSNGHPFGDLTSELEFTNDGPIAPIPALKELPKPPPPVGVVSAKDTWDQEYEMMATYISCRFPLWTPSSQHAWTDFAEANPQRTAKQWSVIFVNFRHKIYDMIPELRHVQDRSALNAKRVAYHAELKASMTPEAIEAAKGRNRERLAGKRAAMTTEERAAFNANIRKKRREKSGNAQQSDAQASDEERMSGGDEEDNDRRKSRKRKRGGVSTRQQRARSDDEADLEVDDLV